MRETRGKHINMTCSDKVERIQLKDGWMTKIGKPRVRSLPIVERRSQKIPLMCQIVRG